MRFLNHLFLGAAMLSLASGCQKPSSAPPPPEAARAMASIRDGYNREDTTAFCRDFHGIMFSGGFTTQRYLEVNRMLKGRLGEWLSEAYLGQKPQGEEMTVHQWRVRFQKGGMKLVLVLDREAKVTGLWFR